MTKNKKIFLGVLTFLPLVFLVLYFIAFFTMFIGIFNSAQSGNQPNLPFMVGNFAALFAFIFFAALLSIGLMIYYIMHITNSKILDSNQRLMWILIVIFAGMIGFGIYWYMYIWKEAEVKN